MDTCLFGISADTKPVSDGGRVRTKTRAAYKSVCAPRGAIQSTMIGPHENMDEMLQEWTVEDTDVSDDDVAELQAELERAGVFVAFGEF